MAKQPAKVKGNNTSKIRRSFGDPVEAPKPNHRFTPIPAKFAKPGTFTLQLKDVLSAADMNAIENAKKIVFHVNGDTGGINGTETQTALANLMEQQIASSAGADKPAFFYHLGDVVYYNGMTKDYEPQFYDPYTHYPSYIFAIPGNHDCDTAVSKGDPKDTEDSMQGFMDNFCDSTPEYGPYSPYRKTMNQPWPYWVLDSPHATIIGLFSNVDGSLDDPKKKTTEQYNWLVDQLKKAPKSKCLIVTVHHPCFSLDSVHGGYPLIVQAIDDASKKAGRGPDAIFSGHVHNYQRFTRTTGKKQIPYVIAGAGGYINKPGSMHRLQKDPGGNHINVPFQTKRKDLVMNYYNQTNPGFLRIEIDNQFIHCQYFTINFDGSAPPTAPDDDFKFDWKANKAVALV